MADVERVIRQRKLAQSYITDFICAAIPPLRSVMYACIVYNIVTQEISCVETAA